MSEHAHNEEHLGPTGADAVEPDYAPMRVLSITIVVLAIFVIGSGIALAEWLSAKVEQEKQAKQFSKPPTEITAMHDAGEKRLGSYGFDEEAQAAYIPVAKAMEYLVANPGKVVATEVWSDVTLQSKPEPAKK